MAKQAAKIKEKIHAHYLIVEKFEIIKLNSQTTCHLC